MGNQTQSGKIFKLSDFEEHELITDGYHKFVSDSDKAFTLEEGWISIPPGGITNSALNQATTITINARGVVMINPIKQKFLDDNLPPEDPMNSPLLDFADQIVHEVLEFAFERGIDVAFVRPSVVVSRPVFIAMLAGLVSAKSKYQKARDAALAEYRKVTGAAQAEYDKYPVLRGFIRDSAKENILNLFATGGSIDSISRMQNLVSVDDRLSVYVDKKLIHFGIDDDFQVWQARACFDNGSNPSFTIGITDDNFI